MFFPHIWTLQATLREHIDGLRVEFDLGWFEAGLTIWY